MSKCNSGYCYHFKTYTGQDKTPGIESVSVSVDIQLVEPLLGKGYTTFLDNWYSSLNLFKLFHGKNRIVVGTERKNQDNMPKKLASYKLKKGEARTLACLHHK